MTLSGYFMSKSIFGLHFFTQSVRLSKIIASGRSLPIDFFGHFCCRMHRLAAKDSECQLSAKTPTKTQRSDKTLTGIIKSRLQFETVKKVRMLTTVIPGNDLRLYPSSYAVRSAIIADVISNHIIELNLRVLILLCNALW